KILRQIERRTHEHGKQPTTDNNSNTHLLSTTNSQQGSNRPKRLIKPIERYGIDSNAQYQEQPKQHPDVQPKAKKSALGKHVNEQHHQIDWDKIKILDMDTNDYRLKIRESIAIKQHNRTANSIPLLIFPEGITTKKPKVKIKIREPLNEHIFKKWAQPAINAFYKYYLYQLVVPNMDILIGYFKLFDSKESVTQAENEYYREQVKQSEQAHLTVIARDII
ncbi:unnamed protein product, partial [Rotaria sp. Silwood2]